jgi:formate hydrogenlyase subunit 6/NADH:ubiquinone oxidoreductase subunit I
MSRPGAALGYALKMLMQKPATVLYPYEKMEPPEGLRGKISFDIDKCTGCTLCSQVCPSDTIQMVERDGTLEDERVARLEKKGTDKVRRYKKRPDFYLFRCTYCAMCSEVCPTDAIKLTTQYNMAVVDKNDYVLLQESELKR